MASLAGSDDRSARLIALDWGTTSLRAYLLGDAGSVLESRSESWGIMQLPAGGFAEAFRLVTRDWRSRFADLPAIASGMVGSAQGWVEVAYCSAPTGVDALARSLAQVPAGPLSIVPGIAQLGDPPNVMRGEETQIVGAIALAPKLSAHSLLLLPGTHSKWARVQDGEVRDFTTYLTGELFGVLSAHSILGRFARDSGARPDQDTARRAFERGVLAARGSAAGMAPMLFSARSLVLAGRLEPEASLDYLSGLLIGEELRCGLAAGDAPSALIGDATLCGRYSSALELFGVSGVSVLEHTAPAGLWTIARRANLVGPTPAGVVA
jgi:2-dehydro-3-deoxygalactonokinase